MPTATSALARVLRKPNDYQSISDFLLNLTRSLYCEGNAYAVALRNSRYEISELHLMRSREVTAMVGEDGSIFYNLGGNEILERRLGAQAMTVPGRDVLHVRLHTPRHPLKGESPILAAAMDIAAGNAAVQRQLAFFQNESKPSFILSSDHVLNIEQSRQLRASWEEQTKGAGAGGTPILTAGLKPIPVETSATDAQLAETLKMSDQAVALAFRVPLQILGIGGTPYASTEMLMQSWIASGLGFALNHIEEAFGLMFGLRGVPDEYVEFNTSALLRSAYKDRIDGLTKGIIGGLYSPDEARAEMELPAVPGGFGQEPRVQQQVVPLSYYEKLLEQQEAAAALPPPEPAVEPEPDEAEDEEQRSVRSLSWHLDARAEQIH